MAEQSKRIWTKILAIDMLMVCVSISIAVVGQMLEAIKQAYSLTLSQAGLLVSMQSIGGLAVALMCVFFVDSLNKKKIIVFSGIMICVLLLIIAIKLPIVLLFGVFILLGLFTGMVNILTNAVMSETVQKNPARNISFMHMLFSLSSVLIPLISFAIYTKLGLSGVFLIIGGFALVWAVYSVFAFKNEVSQKFVANKIDLKFRMQEMIKVIKTPGMKLVGLIVFLAACWQLSSIYYVSALFSEMAGNASDGAFALSVLFLGMMISRFFYTIVANRFSPGRVLAIGCFFGAAIWLAAMLTSDILIKTILIGISALFCGNNFPVSFATACRLFPKNTATAIGIAFSGYFLALFIFLPIIGAIGDAVGLNNALIFLSAPLIIAVPLALILHRKMKPSFAG